MIRVPDVVRNKAQVVGAAAWLEALPALVSEIERDWGITTGATFGDASEALVVAATMRDGTPAVLKLMIPRDLDSTKHEITALRLADGDGCVRLLRDDASRGALLLERLGRSMHDAGLPYQRRQEILCDAAMRMWRPAQGFGLPTGAEKGRWLIRFISEKWEKLGRPCSERAVAYAIACAERRIAAHKDARSVLVHGDVHEWNALEADGGFKLIDPDGLLAEAEYDLGILMREDPVELMDGDPRERARWLADRAGLDAAAIWEWGAAERVSTGLLCVEIGLEPVGSQMLEAAERVVRF